MRGLRFSIASMLVVIGILGVALAALCSPSYLWANVTFSLAFGSLLVAIVNVIYGRGERRAFWVGFSLCGGAYFAVCTMPALRESLCPRLATEVILDILYPHVSPPASPPVFPTVALTTPPSPAPYYVGASDTMFNGTPITLPVYASPPAAFPQIPIAGGSWAAWSQPDRTNGVGFLIGTISLVSSEAFRQIGHSMATLVVGMIGGLYSRRRYKGTA